MTIQSPIATRVGSTPGFPKAILSYSRVEWHELPLTVLARTAQPDGTVTYAPGELPASLQGHVFIASPVGSVASYAIPGTQPPVVLPAQDGWTNLLNGDGMVYRLDFHQTPNQTAPGKAWLTTRLVKPPAFFADQITHAAANVTDEVTDEVADEVTDEFGGESGGESGDALANTVATPSAPAAPVANAYQNLQFWNIGIARFSLQLGMCNQVNTGLQWVKFPGDRGDRLIITNDASRPYELDPCTLKTLAPVGLNQNWAPMLDMPFAPPFALPPVMSAAHPCFDPGTDPAAAEFLTVNVQRSARTTLRLPVSWDLQGDRAVKNNRPWHSQFWRGLWELLIDVLIQLLELALELLDFLGLAGHNRVYLGRWQGSGAMQKWPVTLPRGRRIKIRQSSHMMGLTENHVIIVDTAFKLAPKDMLPGALLRPLQRWLKKIQSFDMLDNALDNMLGTTKKIIDQELEWLAQRLTYPQVPDTAVYMVARSQLTTVPPEKPIVAQRVTVPGEFAHFLTDYAETPDGRIVLHPAMTYASDPAEFINKVDTSIYNTDMEKALREMAGMWAAPTDVNSPAVVVIDPTGKRPVQKYELALAEALRYTLFLGLYAYSDAGPTLQLEDIYWSAGATDPKLFTQEIYDLYANYKYRHVAIAEMKTRLQAPTPMYMLRVQLDRAQLHQALSAPQPPATPILQVADSYEMPAGYIANSPQFIPLNGVAGAKAGYVLCDVIHSDHFISDPSLADPKLLPSTDPMPDNWSLKTELWIFDARDLAMGPLYKLSHAQLNMGLSLHTAWAKTLVPAALPDYNVAQDYGDLVAKAAAAQSPAVGAQIKQVFEEVYRRFNAARE